jgi:hypothetical protein
MDRAINPSSRPESGRHDLRRSDSVDPGLGEPVEVARRATSAAGEPVRYGQHPDGFIPISLLTAGLDQRRLGPLGD